MEKYLNQLHKDSLDLPVPQLLNEIEALMDTLSLVVLNLDHVYNFVQAGELQAASRYLDRLTSAFGS